MQCFLNQMLSIIQTNCSVLMLLMTNNCQKYGYSRIPSHQLMEPVRYNIVDDLDLSISKDKNISEFSINITYIIRKT